MNKDKLLDPKYFKDSNYGNKANSVIIKSKKNKNKKRKQEKKNELTAAQIKKRKAIQKKLEQGKIEREKKQKREELYEQLKKNQMKKEHIHLLHKSSQRGQKATMKEKVQRAFHEEKAGLQSSDNSKNKKDSNRLFKIKKVEEKNIPIEFNENNEFGNAFEIKKVSKVVSVLKGTTRKRKFKSMELPIKSLSTSTINSKDQINNTNDKNKSNKKHMRNNDLSNSDNNSISGDSASSSSEEDKEESIDNVFTTNDISNNNDMEEDHESNKKTGDNDVDSDDDDSDSDAVDDEEDSDMDLAVLNQESKLPQISNNLISQLSMLASGGQIIKPNVKLGAHRSLVHLNRLLSIQKVRSELPVFSMEQEIVEMIHQNDVCIISGATGSGKTTQVPQFLYEAGYAHGWAVGQCNYEKDNNKKVDRKLWIGVTEPRRVAVVSTAKRVAEETNLKYGKEVSYQIRYDSKIKPETRIKFMTDGILLREVQNDFLLQKYAVIMIDEAHERDLNTDVLIGLLSRIVQLRRQLYEYQTNAESISNQNIKKLYDSLENTFIVPLKVIIMSATLQVKDFVENVHLFPIPPPIINVEARQHPVTIHFSRRTPMYNYLDAIFKRVVQIHTRLPEGGILVFLTGRNEITTLVKRLSTYFKNACGTFVDAPTTDEKQLNDNNKNNNTNPINKANKKITNESNSKNKQTNDCSNIKKENKNNENIQVLIHPSQPECKLVDVKNEIVSNQVETHPLYNLNDSDSDSDDSDSDDSDSDDSELNETLSDPKHCAPVHVLPLYSLLPTELQMRVFQPPPINSRLIVVSTNVAETSLTIPSIKYVVDCGREKKKVYEQVTGTSSFVVDWISQASASQRAGRAGRTGPGHVYRLYSSAVFNDQFPMFSEPEILRTPLDNVILQMKNMNISDVESFPFPTPPNELSLRSSIQTLKNLQALENENAMITSIGRNLSLFPISPRYSKMISLAHQKHCLLYTILIVASVSVDQLWLDTDSAMLLVKRHHSFHNNSDDNNNMDEESNERKELMKKMNNTKKQWKHLDSDLLTNLQIFGAFEYDCRDNSNYMKCDKRKAREFCEENFLRYKSMDEVRNLMLQLIRIILRYSASSKRLENFKNRLNNPIVPPSSEQEVLLRQIITSGLVDQVAHLADLSTVSFKETELTADIEDTEEKQRKLFGAYQLMYNDEPAFIHPTSVLYKQSPRASFLVYQQLVRGSRTFMKNVTIIEADWLFRLAPHFCTFSAPLDDPLPVYDKTNDRIQCFVKVNYGPRYWKLPLHRIPYPDNDTKMRHRHFARLLLEGKIIEFLEPFRPFLVHKPSTLIRPFPPKQTRALLSCILDNDIDTCAKLQKFWETKPNFLLEEFKTWVSPMKQQVLIENWPPL